MIWFWADPHLGHENIIRYCRRPFLKDGEPDIEAHDRTLIENFNARVAPDDEVWIVGDFCWWHLDPERVRAYYRQLNGYKHLVIGNHDTDDDGRVLPVLEELFGDRLHWYVEIKIGGDGRRKPLSRKGGQRVVLFHYGIRAWQGWFPDKETGRRSWHLYGHHHGRLRPNRTSFDVGVDACDHYAPISWPEIVKKMQRLEAQQGREDPI